MHSDTEPNAYNNENVAQAMKNTVKILIRQYLFCFWMELCFYTLSGNIVFPCWKNHEILHLKTEKKIK